MVSKTIVVCLAVLASISMIQATTDPGFGYCVGAYTYFNQIYGLNIDLVALLGGVLGLNSNIGSGILDVVIGSGGTIPQVDAPDTLGALVETNIKISPLFGELCAKQFDSTWDKNIFTDVNLAITVELFNNLKLNIDDYPFLNGAISLGDCRQKVLKISLYLQSDEFQTGPLAQLAVLINDLLSIVNSTDNSVEVFASAMIKFFKIKIALCYMDGGYLYTQQYRDTWLQTCNAVYQNTSGLEEQVILEADVNVNNESACGCLKK